MNLKALRTKANLTQKQLADKLGTTQQTIARWETGKTSLNTAQIYDLCTALDCTAADLMGQLWHSLSSEFEPNEEMLREFGEPYGTLKLNLGLGEVRYAVGDMARDHVLEFMERHSVLNRKADKSEWLILSTLHRRLLFVNGAAIRSVELVSDDVEQMPDFAGHFPEGEVPDDAAPVDPDDALANEGYSVVFKDGTEGVYMLSEPVANGLYELFLSGEAPAGSFLMVEDEEKGQSRKFLRLDDIAMISVGASEFAELTDNDGNVEAYA